MVGLWLPWKTFAAWSWYGTVASRYSEVCCIKIRDTVPSGKPLQKPSVRRKKLPSRLTTLSRQRWPHCEPGNRALQRNV